MPAVYHHRLFLLHWPSDRNSQTMLLYGMRVMRELASKLVLFFLPLFLFRIGESTPILISGLNSFQQGMLTIAAYYLISKSLSLFVLIPIGELIRKIGPERSFLISQTGYILYFMVLYKAELFPWLILVAAALETVQIFFWNSYYTLMSVQVTKNKMGSNMGAVQFLINVVAMISPIIGGLVVVWFGYPMLFLMGLVCMLVGMVIAALLKSTKITDTVSWQEFFSWMREAGYRKLAASYAGRYINDAVLVVWPLYVFFLLGTVDRVGYLYGLSLFVSMIVIYFAGSFFDKHRTKKPFFLSGGLLSVVWVLKTQIIGFWSIAVVDIFERLTANFHWLFFDTTFMRRGKGSQALSFFVYREVIISVVAIFFWLAFAAMFVWFVESWKGLFLLAGFGVMLSLLVKDHKDSSNG
jgi:MFS family permease